MNDLYFFCMDCKSFVDAGYRWAYSSLADAGMKPNAFVTAESILAVEKYWSTSDPGLISLLAVAKTYLLQHFGHRLRYGDFDFLFEPQEEWADWLDESKNPEELPRYFLERERCLTWDDLVKRVAQLPIEPWWWSDEKLRLHAKARFDVLRLARFFTSAGPVTTDKRQFL